MQTTVTTKALALLLLLLLLLLCSVLDPGRQAQHHSVDCAAHQHDPDNHRLPDCSSGQYEVRREHLQQQQQQQQDRIKT
jgi:hypothetical protein